MDATALSLAARGLRSRLAAYLALPEGQILIGNPSTAAEIVSGQAGKQFLNVFFYRVEMSGYPADATSDDPIYVRADCLLTAFGNDEGGGANRVTAGENDLKLIGGVLSALHEQPNLVISTADGATSAALQIVPAPLTVDSINHLWATQVNISYRPSLAYELAILPAPFATRTEQSQLVAEVVLDVRAPSVSGPLASGAPDPEWVPELRFAAGGGLHQVLSFNLSERPSSLDVVVAGRVGEHVKLRWSSWTSAEGWRVATETDRVIDSATLDGASAAALPLPTSPGQKQQLMLTAVYDWLDPVHARRVEVTSNLLLVSIHLGSAP